MVWSPTSTKTHASSAHAIINFIKLNCYCGTVKRDDLFTVSWMYTNSSPVHIILFASHSGAPWLQNVTKYQCSGDLHIKDMLTHHRSGESDLDRWSVWVMHHDCESFFMCVCLLRVRERKKPQSKSHADGLKKNNETIHT